MVQKTATEAAESAAAVAAIAREQRGQNVRPKTKDLGATWEGQRGAFDDTAMEMSLAVDTSAFPTRSPATRSTAFKVVF